MVRLQCNSPRDSPCGIRVDSTSTLRWYVDFQISTNFHVIFTYFFDVISLVEKSTLFPLTIFDVISMVGKPTLSPRTFFNLISMVETYTLFQRTFFGVILLFKKSMLFPRTSFNVILMVSKFILFARTFFKEILMGKNSTPFLVSCKLMKSFNEVLLR